MQRRHGVDQGVAGGLAVAERGHRAQVAALEEARERRPRPDLEEERGAGVDQRVHAVVEADGVAGCCRPVLAGGGRGAPGPGEVVDHRDRRGLRRPGRGRRRELGEDGVEAAGVEGVVDVEAPAAHPARGAGGLGGDDRGDGARQHAAVGGVVGGEVEVVGVGERLGLGAGQGHGQHGASGGPGHDGAAGHREGEAVRRVQHARDRRRGELTDAVAEDGRRRDAPRAPLLGQRPREGVQRGLRQGGVRQLDVAREQLPNAARGDRHARRVEPVHGVAEGRQVGVGPPSHARVLGALTREHPGDDGVVDGSGGDAVRPPLEGGVQVVGVGEHAVGQVGAVHGQGVGEVVHRRAVSAERRGLPRHGVGVRARQQHQRPEGARGGPRRARRRARAARPRAPRGRWCRRCRRR